MNCCTEYDQDPFLESGHILELSTLIEKSSADSCSIDEFVAGDNDVLTCIEMDDDNRQKTFLIELTNHLLREEEEDEDSDWDKDSDEDSDGGVNDATVQMLEIEPKIKFYKEAIVA